MMIARLLGTALLSAMLATGAGAAEKWEHVSRKALSENRKGNTEAALEKANKAVELAESRFDKGDNRMIQSVNNLAYMYAEAGKYEDAERLYLRALELLKHSNRTGKRREALLLNNLASVYQAQKKYDKAEQMFKKCLAIREAGLGKDAAPVGIVLRNLGSLYLDQGKTKQAEAALARSLQILVNKPRTSTLKLISANARDLQRIYEKKGEKKKVKELEALQEKATKAYESRMSILRKDRHPKLPESEGK